MNALFMVANYGGVMRDVGPLIMEVGVTKSYMWAFSFFGRGKKMDTGIVMTDVSM